MAESGYRHIFVNDGYSERIDYTTPSRGGGRDIPRRPVGVHGKWLRQRLDSAWQQADAESKQRQAVALPTRSGTYLEFRSDAGAELVSKSLENRPKGIRLLSVTQRHVEDEEKSVTFATVFIPAEKQGYFLQRIEQYRTERTKKDEPKNRPLIDSIADIQLAVTESFWTDSVPMPTTEAAWCEVWLRTEIGEESVAETGFRALLAELSIEAVDGALLFPERTVIQINADGRQLSELVKSSGDIAEFRLAKDTAAFWLDLPNADQAAAVDELLGRLDITDEGVAVCVLDTGVNNGHLLLQPVLDTDDCHTVRSEWKINDQHGHGTLMAGLAAFGDLHNAMSSGKRLRITHLLESVKILPKPGDDNPHHPSTAT